MRSILFVFAVFAVVFVATVYAAPTVSHNVTTVSRNECGLNLERPSSFFKRHFDLAFLKKFFKHLIPFTSRTRVKMQFFLYKRDFPNCGRELVLDQYETIKVSGFNASHPTRIIIHGWMAQSKGSFNRAVKNAYLSLVTHSPTPALEQIDNSLTTDYNDTPNDVDNNINNNSDVIDPPVVRRANHTDDFNIIVVDWSVISSNVNYFGVVDLIEDLGFLLAEFVRFLHLRADLQYDDVYLIGHSLGAQIAGSTGKQVRPHRFNTIFALDAAGPKFRHLSEEFRIDASDAVYVESILTSSTLGYEEPVGNATFYPNFGRDQKKCYIYGCSHSRSYDYFAESITSPLGFWGRRCERKSSQNDWIVLKESEEFRMGGEPSTPKEGTFYVETNGRPPYAMGRKSNT